MCLSEVFILTVCVTLYFSGISHISELLFLYNHDMSCFDNNIYVYTICLVWTHISGLLCLYNHVYELFR